MTFSATGLTSQQRELAAINAKLEVERGCQKYPHSKIKVGAVLYKVDVAEWNDGTTTISIDEWVVRSIKRKRGTQTSMGRRRLGNEFGDTAPKYVNVCAKIKGETWVKKSRKANDYGWSKSISRHRLEQFQVGKPLSPGLFTTPLSALKWALKEHEKRLDASIVARDNESKQSEIDEWNEEIAHTTKSVNLLKKRIKKIAKK